MVDFICLGDTTLAVRFLYWDEQGRVYRTSTTAYEEYNALNYASYLVTVPHKAAGRYQVTTPDAVARAYYSFTPVLYVDGTVANDEPLATSGESLDVRYVAGRPALLGQPGNPFVAGTASEVVMASTSGGVERSISQFQNTRSSFQWRITNAAGIGMNLKPGGTANNIQFKVHTADANTQVLVATVAAGDVVLTESEAASGVFDTITVTVLETKVPSTLAPAVYHYKLWDLTRKFVYGSGDYTLLRAPLPA